MDLTQNGFIRTPDEAYKQLPEMVRGFIEATCMKHMHSEDKHFVFDPLAVEVTREGASVVFPLDGTTKKVNAYLDDFGSVEAAREEIGGFVDTQYRVRLVTD